MKQLHKLQPDFFYIISTIEGESLHILLCFINILWKNGMWLTRGWDKNSDMHNIYLGEGVTSKWMAVEAGGNKWAFLWTS